MLAADDIAVSYDSASRTCQLQGITLSFEPGKITAVVGPNGSGKSTLIRALSRVLQPYRGVVLLNGSDLYRDVSARSSAQSISVMPQDTHVVFDFTGRDVVAMGRAPHHQGLTLFAGESSSDRAAIDNALSRAEITPEQADRPVMTLSGGERQRILIARSLVQGADVILLDEPTSSLDLAHQTNLMEELRFLTEREHKTVVIVLHDLAQAAAYADRMVVLNFGKIVADGTVNQVLTREMVREVYQCDVILSADMVTGRPTISVVSKTYRNSRPVGSRIHVICGGGGGASVMRALSTAGAKVSAGFLNLGDFDQIVAAALDIPHIALAPFAAVPDLTDAEIMEIVDGNDFVLFTPAAIGDGNLASLRSAVRIAASGGRVCSFRSAIDSQNVTSEEIDDEVRSLSLRLEQSLATPPFTEPDKLIEYVTGERDAGTS